MMQEKRENDEMRNSVVNEIVEEKRLERKLEGARKTRLMSLINIPKNTIISSIITLSSSLKYFFHNNF
jgi:hypothetical protein